MEWAVSNDLQIMISQLLLTYHAIQFHGFAMQREIY